MTILACILAASLVIQYVLNARERRQEREAWEAERAKLLDRIQHPEVRHVEPGEQVEYEPPRDEAELAQIGLVVPEFINVGGDE